MEAQKERVILRCDPDSSYALAKLPAHPELREVPAAVCGDPNTRRGIILAKNEAAKRFGIVTAETIWQAKKEKHKKPESAMDAIRLKCGSAALRFGTAAEQEEDTQS